MRDMTFTLDDGEALVVAPLDFWEGLVDWFDASAEEFPEQADGWLIAKEHVQEWIKTTA